MSFEHHSSRICELGVPHYTLKASMNALKYMFALCVEDWGRIPHLSQTQEIFVKYQTNPIWHLPLFNHLLSFLVFCV